MALQFKKSVKAWREKHRLFQKEAADRLQIPFPSYRKYEYGKRTPNALARAELERRMSDYDAGHPVKA